MQILPRQPKSPDALPMAPAALMSIGPLRRERGENNNETIAGAFRVTILPYPSSKRLAHIVCYTEDSRAPLSWMKWADCLDPQKRVRLEALT
ncbi:MAG: hypothetical protein DMG31_00015 [Acidobacteria bacterium]|nr:MAG: hypothetical protein DMG31_00015 [Acidobacteriota bacterium]